MEVYIEMYPDRYVLKPNDVMEIVFDHDGEAPGLHAIVHEDGGLQIYLDAFDTALVTINGKPAKPWAD